MQLEGVWFRIAGIPMKFRDKGTAFYAVGLVGKSLSLEKISLRNLAFIKVKIGCKNVGLVLNTRVLR